MERKKRSTGSPLTGQSATNESTNRIASIAAEIVASRVFDWAITGVIFLQALTLAIESTPAILPSDKEGKLVITAIFGFIQSLVIDVFITEAALRLIALYPKPLRYFKDPWNCFDFTIIVLSFLPTTGQFSTIARLVRLIRILRLVTKSTELRAIVSTLARSIPSIFNILILLAILFFIYAIIGYHLFRNVDPGIGLLF